MMSFTKPSVSPIARALPLAHERKLADFEFQALFLRRAFGQADARDLRLAVGAAGKLADFLRL